MKTLYLVDTHRVMAALTAGMEGAKTTVLHYDAMRFLSALQGILNRERPVLYLFTERHDRFWLDYMSEEGKLLSEYERKALSTFDEILLTFKEEIVSFGLVLWDEAVPATVNVAGTLAGVLDLLPIRGNEEDGSILSRIRALTGAETRMDLRGMFTGKGTIPGTSRPSSGSAKCDAYLWAMAHYMDRTADDLLFFTVDATSWSEEELIYPDLGNAFVYNQDYAVARRAFVFDLSCWGDETPCDDKNQPMGTDLAVMKEILDRQYERTAGQKMITFCGFNPWHIKYTRHMGKGKHGEVESEWRLTEIISAYNCIKDADAAGLCSLANASLYRHYPLKARYKNHRPKKEIAYDPETNYVLLYIGDYDAGAWTARMIPRWYADPALGQVPMMWAFNPNLSDRIPQAFDFVYERYTENDFFCAGDSGAGYNNPRLVYAPRVHSDKPSAIDVWNAHNKKYFDRFDLDVIGFVIDGDKLTEEYEMKDMATYATLGVGYLSLGQDLPIKIVDGSCFVPVSGDVSSAGTDADRAAKAILHYMRVQNPAKRFHFYRTILSSPSHIKEVMEKVQAQSARKVVFCDPYSFFTMAKAAKEQGLTY